MLGGGGTVSPGTSPGVLTIDGNYVQGAGGTLAIEIAGVGAGTQYDQLIVTGNASLGGNLNVALIGGFIPAPGSTFTVVQAGGSVSGTFSGVSMPSFPILTASYPASGVNVTASAAPNTDPILNEQVHASQDAPPTSPVEPGNTNSISPGAPDVPNYYLETDGGQTVPVSITPTVPTGIYVNLETGQTALIAPGTTPDPGTYLNPANSSVLVVVPDPITRQPVFLAGPAPSVSPLKLASTIEPGSYVNVVTGQAIFLTAGTLPEPGTYFSPETLAIIAVTIDSATGLPVIMSGSAADSSGVGVNAQLRRPGVCK